MIIFFAQPYATFWYCFYNIKIWDKNNLAFRTSDMLVLMVLIQQAVLQH